MYRGEGERGGRGERGKGKEGEGERYSFEVSVTSPNHTTLYKDQCI